jgi:hypothetical protein
MKVKNKTTGNWDQITLGSVTIDNSLGSDSTTHGASVHAVNTGLAGKISGDGSVEKIVRSETAPTGTEATIWIEPSDFDSAEATILKDTLEDEDLDKAPTVHAVKQAIDNVENIDYDSLPSQGKIEYTGPAYITPTGYTKSEVPYSLESLGARVEDLEEAMVYPLLGYEKLVGIYYDGKPIYKRVYLFTMTSSNTAATYTLTGLSTSNIAKIIKVEGNIERAKSFSNNSNIGPYYYKDTDYWNFYMATPKSNAITVRGGSDWPKRPYDFVLEVYYTKTTDNGRAVLITDSSN